MVIIVDASVAVKWVVPEPDSELAGKLFHQSLPLLAPDILLAEVGNVLSARSRRGEMSAAQAAWRLARLQRRPALKLVPDRQLLDVALDLSLRIAHPIYDCFYLALAIQRDGRVVTADRRFLSAVARHGLYADRLRPLDSRDGAP